MKINQTLHDNKDYIIEAYKNGASTPKLSKEFKCSPGTIWRFLDSVGVLVRKHKHSKHDKIFVNDLIKRFTSGQTIREIGKEFGIGNSYILNILIENGCDVTSYFDRKTPISTYSEEIIRLYESGMNPNKISKLYNTHATTIWKLLEKNSVELRNYRVYQYDKTFFETVDTEAKAWVLGWWYADGNNNKRGSISIELADQEIVETIKTLIQYNGPTHLRKMKKETHSQQYKLEIGCKKMSEDLTKLGCPPNKTFTIKFPTVDIIPNHLLRHFVRGYFEGDGCVGFEGRNSQYLRIGILGTQHLLQGIGDFLNLNPPKIYPYKKIYNLRIYSQADCKLFYDVVYRDATYFLKRKRDRFEAILG